MNKMVRLFWKIFVLLVFAMVFAMLNLNVIRQKSATFDEPIHVADGYLSLKNGDYRLDPGHPPLLRIWAALPLLWCSDLHVNTTEIDQSRPRDWVNGKFMEFSNRFMFLDNDAELLLTPPRVMVLLLGIALGVLLFFWILQWLGSKEAIAGLFLYTFEPNITAHSCLVTTDLGMTLFFFGTLYFLWRYCNKRNLTNIMCVAIMFSMAIVSKHSSVILYPIIILITLVVWRRKKLSIPNVALMLFMILIFSYIFIWAFYSFRYQPSESYGWLFNFTANIPQTLSSRIVDWIDARKLLPNAYIQGLFYTQRVTEGRDSFLAGEYSTHGMFWYFPFAFVIKTPITLIALFLSGLFVCFKKIGSWGFDGLVFAVIPAVIYIGCAMAVGINIGLRHILPIYPFVILIAVASIHVLFSGKSRWSRSAIGVALLFYLIEFLSIYPDNLAFFNRFVGGPEHGSSYLVDSNIDWGQDLKGLKKWMKSNDVKSINLAYFGTAFPEYYHIDSTLLLGSFGLPKETTVYFPKLPGYIALSETVMSGVYSKENYRFFYRPLAKEKPVAIIGHSIRIYWVDSPWWEGERERIQELESTYSNESTNPVCENNLAWLLATAKDPSLRDGKRALALAQSANHATGKSNPEILETLAAARALTGDYEGALVTAKKALEIAQKAGNKELVLSLKKGIVLYGLGKSP
ncbi:MAG: glycosyltransferase family 39 protein [Chlamydiia bacterium]